MSSAACKTLVGAAVEANRNQRSKATPHAERLGESRKADLLT
jgi:hypothetical protein